MTIHEGGRAVLVVEDEPLVRLDIAQALATAGFTVIEAGTAEEALEALAGRTDIDLIFTDIEMPGHLSGLDLVRIVHARWPDMPVLVTSGMRMPDASDLARFFPKPYDAAKIVTEAQALAV
ncbi:response regulator [Pelagibacterium halotolerans]|uniref:response regulator n=1 Tax=Pelagibacterium halotolerans TaxID=531813 RepID=UPI00384B6027